MAVVSESVRSSLRISYDGGDTWNYTVSRLNTEAEAKNLLLLAEAISTLQGTAPAALVSTNEYQLVNS